MGRWWRSRTAVDKIMSMMKKKNAQFKNFFLRQKWWASSTNPCLLLSTTFPIKIFWVIILQLLSFYLLVSFDSLVVVKLS
jgi:hypothetical protein